MNKYDIYYIDLKILKNLNIQITTLVKLDTPYLIYNRTEFENYRFENYSIEYRDLNFILLDKKNFNENIKYFEKIDHKSNNYTKLLLTENKDFLLKVLKELND